MLQLDHLTGQPLLLQRSQGLAIPLTASGRDFDVTLGSLVIGLIRINTLFAACRAFSNVCQGVLGGDVENKAGKA